MWSKNKSLMLSVLHLMLTPALLALSLALFLPSSVVIAEETIDLDSARDAELAAELKAQYAADPELRYLHAQISVRDQIAYLFGAIVPNVDMCKFEDIARQVPGIVDVVNFMNHTSTLPLECDPQIKWNAEHHMIYTPFGDTSDVVLTIEDGVAYLDGVVESWRGVASAENAAYAGGASKIVNRLKILHPALPSSYYRSDVKDQLIQGR